MNFPIVTKFGSGALRAFSKPFWSSKGNIMVYLIVVILIFGVLGVTIVSLFTTATSSSATPNDARRAYYIAESGVRFATSRIKNLRFQSSYISQINTTAQYTLADGSSFTIDIFSPWFLSTTDQTAPGVNPFTLEIPNDGKIPGDFSIPSSNVFLVNWGIFNGSPPSNAPPIESYAEITASSAIAEATSLTITMGNSPVLAVEAGQTVCLAVRPTAADSNLQTGEDISIAAEAKNFFPPRNGAIRIVTADNQVGEYYYEELVDETTQVRLTNLAPMPQSSFAELANFSTDDWVVLSPYNYRVITTGTSGDVTSEIGLNKQVWVFPNSGQWTIFEREFIENAVPNVTDELIIDTSLGATEDDDEIQIGDQVDTDAGFGTVWYGGDKSIGSTNLCEGGRCLFGRGLRVFFTLDYSGEGEGFVFALIAAANYPTVSDPPVNTRDSAGGDVERSELLGYAGDSRENASGTPFLDGSLNGDGLLPPKMGIEFDTRTNFDGNFEQTLIYCNGSSLNPDTRNDPKPNGNSEDAVQLVFWGSETIGTAPNPAITCRDDDATYDDNKHDADDIFEKWQFNTGNNVQSSPAVGTDGTVYFGSDSHRVYALNPADRLAGEAFPTANEWEYDTGANVESWPAIGADGTIYIGSDSKKVYALNPAERLAGSAFPSTGEWEFLTGGNVKSSPAIGSDGTVFIGSDDKKFYALNPAERLAGSAFPSTGEWEFSDSSFSAPPANALGAISQGRPAIGPTGNIYVSDKGRTLVALDPEDRKANLGFPTANEWLFDLGDANDFAPGIDPITGKIYSDRTGNRLVALNPDGTMTWPDAVFAAGSDIDSTPAVDNDGTVYFGTDAARALIAVDPSGTEKWRFSTGSEVDTSPAIGPDGTIYFGSNDHKLYAVGSDGVSATGTEKFSYDTGGAVRSSPAVDPRDESVYVGSDSNRLHAINQLAEPRSYRDDSVEIKKLVSSEDFTEITFTDTNDSNNWLQHDNGLWAVRIEVTYDGQVNGLEEYTLKTWVEKCSEAGCSKFLSSNFRDTLRNYKVSTRPPKLDQTIKLSAEEHAKFERFLFGFTSAAATGDTQAAIIKFFELSFIRVSDPDVTSDPNLNP